jgi:phage terminase small subunit
LTDKQRIFIKEYLIDKNATRSAIAAGYSAKNASEIGSKLVRKSGVRAAIEVGLAEQTARIQKRAGRFEVTRERIISELALMAFADIDEYVQVTDRGVRIIATKDRRKKRGRAIKRITESTSLNGGSQGLELHDKKGALDSLAKMCGWVTEKVEHTGKDGGPIASTLVSMTPEERRAELEALRKAREISGDE